MRGTDGQNRTRLDLKIVRGLRFAGLVALLGAVPVLAGCNGSEPPKREAVRVKTVAARTTDIGPVITLTGEIKARYQNDLSFRVNGKIIARTADAGDACDAGRCTGPARS